MEIGVGTLFFGMCIVIPMFHCSSELNGEEKMVGISDIRYKEVTEGSWTELSGRKVFFGHQSLGADIIDGVAHLKEESESIDFDIKESRLPVQAPRGILVHDRIGQNGTPESKIDDFVSLLTGEFGETVDIGMMKMCFVDVDGTTNVDFLFEYYADAVAELETKRPDLTIVHCAIPLTVRESKAKGFVKRILGKATLDDANIRRSHYNRLLQQRFGPTDPIFDIAGWEALHEDGSFETFESGGEWYPALRPDFTEDGGHLNESGKRQVAVGFLQTLAGIPTKTATE